MLAWQAFPHRPDATAGAYLAVPALERAGIYTLFSTRFGGASEAPWRTLNLSYVSGDDPQRVKTNRNRAIEAIGLDWTRWTAGRQVHGTRVQQITEPESGRGSQAPEDAIPDTDAVWTDLPGVALAVVVADCVPILLADPISRRIAVVHAGWRGLVGGVVANAASIFDDPSRVVGVAGPSIGPCCYEVGADVAGPASEVFGDGVLRGGNLDLWAASAAAMHRAGIGNLTVAGLCTRCESHRFFSHRAGDTGRQAVIACLR